MKSPSPTDICSSSEPIKVETSSEDTPAVNEHRWLRLFFSLWTTVASEGVTVGSLVFAPQRTTTHRTGGLQRRVHYALAEVTGVQASAGTVSVSFLFTEPGVDDVAVALFELVPCPPSLLYRLGHHVRDGKQGDSIIERQGYAPCSLLERVMGASAADGALHREDVCSLLSPKPSAGVRHEPTLDVPLSSVYCDSEDDDTLADHKVGKRPRSLASPAWVRAKNRKRRDSDSPPASTSSGADGMGQQHSFSPSGSQYVERQSTGLPTEAHTCLTFSYTAPRCLHTFFATAFHDIDREIEMKHTRSLLGGDKCASAPRDATSHSPCTVLAIFVTYALLRRFAVYMSMRGHIVRLIDGEDVTRSVRAPPVERAFSSRCKIWHCLLRDDLATECGTVTPLLSVAFDSTHLVSFAESGTEGADCDQSSVAHVRTLIPHLSEEQHVVAHFLDLPREYPRSAADDPVATQRTPQVLKVSGNIFGNNKILVPPSGEQLLLLKTALLPSPDTTTEAMKAPDALSVPHGLLERIALGNLTDASLESLFSAYRGAAGAVQRAGSGPAATFSSIEELHTKLVLNPRRLGEAFPIFAAVLAIVRDIFTEPQRFIATVVNGLPTDDGSGCASDGESDQLPLLPRIALVVPCGSPTSSPSLAICQFIRSLQGYLAPWYLYQLDPSLQSQGSPASVAWHQRGGILLLHCDEHKSQLGALHREADVVIACGKSAAAWVAANSDNNLITETKQLLFAVLSELEVVPDRSHAWLPCSPVQPLPSAATMRSAVHADARGVASTAAELDSLWRSLVAMLSPSEERTRHIGVPKVLQQAIILWSHLNSTHAEGSNTQGLMHAGAHTPCCNFCVEKWCSWTYLRAFVQHMALSCATTTPVSLTEVIISDDPSLPDVRF